LFLLSFLHRLFWAGILFSYFPIPRQFVARHKPTHSHLQPGRTVNCLTSLSHSHDNSFSDSENILHLPQTTKFITVHTITNHVTVFLAGVIQYLSALPISDQV
jgi:hypothetical protein